jgi:hypothetical protein
MPMKYSLNRQKSVFTLLTTLLILLYSLGAALTNWSPVKGNLSMKKTIVNFLINFGASNVLFQMIQCYGRSAVEANFESLAELDFHQIIKTDFELIRKLGLFHDPFTLKGLYQVVF